MRRNVGLDSVLIVRFERLVKSIGSRLAFLQPHTTFCYS